MEASAAIPPLLADWPRAALQPVSTSERIATLDVLRGVALLGILTVNLA